MTTLTAAAVTVLAAERPGEKVCLTAEVAAAWRHGALCEVGSIRPPERPARPKKPVLLTPGQMPKRKIGAGVRGRVALLHALAHIELNAIDLAWDVVARFATPALPRRFAGDWISVAAEEAKHFTMLSQRLEALGVAYGELPAHDGLWEAAVATRHDLAARLAVVPLVLEARGLDVTPAMITKLRDAGDDASAEVLTIIYRDEIGHVAIGRRWFDFACACRGWEPAAAWRRLLAEHHPAGLKPPFNREARDRAGFPQRYYEPAAA